MFTLNKTLSVKHDKWDNLKLRNKIMWIFQHLVTDICFNQWHRLKKTTTFEIKYSWRKVRTFLRVLNMICIYFLYLTFIFSDGFKNHLTWPWWSMRKQSEQIVLIFYLPFSLSWHCLNMKQSEEMIILI